MSHSPAALPTEIFAVRTPWGLKTFVNRGALTTFLTSNPDAEVLRAEIQFTPVDAAEFTRPVRVHRVNLRYKIRRPNGTLVKDITGPAFEICTAKPFRLPQLVIEAAKRAYPEIPSSAWFVATRRVAAGAELWGSEGTSRQVKEFTPPAV
ncbi:hypothetical protein [Kitasatospora sp. MBT63]|uniref:hypothetical protein n=1 Tax=Kitasatospora sp. MBT63 TaxID=1444768 RepID=UPI000539DCF4|nr:hypothetical protein [Kitasatospora sp. MBT63]